MFKKLFFAIGFLFILVAPGICGDIKYIQDYYRTDGTHVSGHYRDVSNNGNPYDNASYLGYND